MSDWEKGMQQAMYMASDDEFWTDGRNTWSVFMLEKYEEAVRAAIEASKTTMGTLGENLEQTEAKR